VLKHARRASRHANTGADGFRHLSQVEILGREVLVGVHDRDHRPLELLIDQAGAFGPGALKRTLQPGELQFAAPLARRHIEAP